MIITNSSRNLRDQLMVASRILKRSTNREVKLALANYISNIYRASQDLTPPIEVDKKTCFSTKRDYSRFIKALNIYSDRMMNDFIINKDFHRDYISDIMTEKENAQYLYVEKDVEEKVYSPDEFAEILYEFLKSIDMTPLFDRMVKNGSIYNQRENETGNHGSILFNPVNGKSDIFIRNFKFTLPKMDVLVHELGHAYDYQLLGIDPERFNHYFYVSFMDEVMSNLFEKLFFDYAIRNNLEPETVKGMLYRYDIDYYYSQFNAFLLSTLSEEDLLSDKFLDLDEEGFYNLFNEYFESLDAAKEHLETTGDIDLESEYSYAYGNIISTFLAEEIKRYGINNTMLADFLRTRTGKFDRDLFERNGWTPENFGKIYRKELEILSK